MDRTSLAYLLILLLVLAVAGGVGYRAFHSRARTYRRNRVREERVGRDRAAAANEAEA